MTSGNIPPPPDGHFWKVPFSWEPGFPVPEATTRLSFRPADHTWLREALAEVMATSLDESDAQDVAAAGPLVAADRVLALAEAHFTAGPGWWLAADREGDPAGFVLPVAYVGCDRGGRPETTILHLGVLPAHRGNRYVDDLLGAATRLLAGTGTWRVFCDASARNHPVLAAFRRLGYREHEPWQRPLVTHAESETTPSPAS